MTDLSSKVAAYKKKLDDYHKANTAYLSSLNGTTNLVSKSNKIIRNLTATTTSTQNNVETCKAVCSAASATCKGATFNSSSKSCQIFNSDITAANIIDSSGNFAIIPESLDKLMVVQRLNDELIVQSKELITASENANDANDTKRSENTKTLTEDYNKLLEERSTIQQQIQEYKSTGDIVESSGLVVNQKYYSYLGLLGIAVLFVLLFMLIVFSSSSSSSSSPYMLTSQRGGGGGKLSNNTYYLIFGIIIITSLFFQVK
jgi:hypothetical protein